MIELDKRLKELNEEKTKLEVEIKQIRNILNQKEQKFLVHIGKILEVENLMKPKEEIE